MEQSTGLGPKLNDPWAVEVEGNLEAEVFGNREGWSIRLASARMGLTVALKIGALELDW